MTEREAVNEALRNSPQFQEDLRSAGVTEQQLHWMDSKEAPLGFQNPRQFESFKQDLLEALRRDGLDDAVIGMKGTATTFYSENPDKPVGHFWDADPLHPGDYDLNIASDNMARELEEIGIEVSATYGVYRTRDIYSRFSGLGEFSDRWSGMLGRTVNIVGYPAGIVPTRDRSEFILVE